MKEIIDSIEITFTHKNIDREIKNPKKVTVVKDTTPSILKVITQDNTIFYYPITSISCFRVITKVFDDRVLM